MPKIVSRTNPQKIRLLSKYFSTNDGKRHSENIVVSLKNRAMTPVSRDVARTFPWGGLK